MGVIEECHARTSKAMVSTSPTPIRALSGSMSSAPFGQALAIHPSAIGAAVCDCEKAGCRISTDNEVLTRDLGISLQG